jgi:hypothetical protein
MTNFKKQKNRGGLLVKTLTVFLIFCFAFTNTTYAISLSDFAKQNTNITNSLLDKIDPDNKEPLVSAKNNTNNHSEALLNPVSLYYNIIKKDLIESQYLLSERERMLQMLENENLITYDAESGGYELAEGVSVEDIIIFSRENGGNFGILTGILTEEFGLSSNSARNVALVAYVALIASGFFLVPGALNEYVDIIGDVTGIKEIAERSEAITAGATIGFAIGGPVGAAIGAVIGGLLGGLFGDDEPGAVEVYKELGVPDIERILDSIKEMNLEGTQFFGGYNFVTIPCTCEPEGNAILLVLDLYRKKPILLKYEAFSSKLYSYYQISTPGVALLGSFEGAGKKPHICEVEVTECKKFPAHGTINADPGTGTSLLPNGNFLYINELQGVDPRKVLEDSGNDGLIDIADIETESGFSNWVKDSFGVDALDTLNFISPESVTDLNTDSSVDLNNLSQ